MFFGQPSIGFSEDLGLTQQVSHVRSSGMNPLDFEHKGNGRLNELGAHTQERINSLSIVMSHISTKLHYLKHSILRILQFCD
jgi:hypothetical protein